MPLIEGMVRPNMEGCPRTIRCLREDGAGPVAPSAIATGIDVAPFGTVTSQSLNEEPPIALSDTVTDDIRVSATGRQTTPTSGIGEGI